MNMYLVCKMSYNTILLTHIRYIVRLNELERVFGGIIRYIMFEPNIVGNIYNTFWIYSLY